MMLVFGLQALAGAQGTINFNNCVADTVDATIQDVDGTQLRGSGFLAQLYVGPAGSAEKDLKAVSGPALSFRDGAAGGCVNVSPNPLRTIAEIPPGAPAVAQIRAWTAISGNSFEEAVTVAEVTKEFKHRYGVSPLVDIAHLGGGEPPYDLPAYLRDLKRFAIHPTPYQLSVIQFGGFLVLSWPEADTNYVLEVTSDLVQTNWSRIQTATTVKGELRFSTNALDRMELFFRLSRY